MSVALYKQTSLRRITAAGTVPDSHRIPLHRGDFCRLIAIFGCKVTKSFGYKEQNDKKISFFNYFSYNSLQPKYL